MMTTQVHQPTRSRPSSDGPGPRWPAPKTASGWRLIERDDVQQELLAGGVALLEARSIGEYRSAHLPGAVNVPGRLTRRNVRALCAGARNGG